jgi:hypothetical protein
MSHGPNHYKSITGGNTCQDEKTYVSANKKFKCNVTKWEEWVFRMCRGMKISLRKYLHKISLRKYSATPPRDFGGLHV